MEVVLRQSRQVPESRESGEQAYRSAITRSSPLFRSEDAMMQFVQLERAKERSIMRRLVGNIAYCSNLPSSSEVRETMPSHLSIKQGLRPIFLLGLSLRRFAPLAVVA